MGLIIDFFTSEDLHRYLDGYMPAARRAAFEEFLCAHPAYMQLVADYQRYNAMLAAAAAGADAPAEAPLPARDAS